LRWVDVAPDRPGADDVRVLEGLAPGERVVVGALERLADGDPVRISP
jgi:multidrug efflux pump subunit AcrA (membrane-fusion protein)